MQIRVSCPGRGIPRQSKVRARPKHHLPPRSLRAKDRSRGAHPKTPSGAGAVRSEHRRRSPNSLAQSAKAHPPPSLAASEGPIPRSPQYAKRSGSGPKQALKAITQFPRAKRESSILPRAFLRAKDRSRGAHPKTPSGAGPVQSEHRNVLSRSPSRASAKA